MAIKNKKIWISLLFTALFLFIFRFGYFIQIPIVIVTTAKTDKEGRKLLELLGMPFRK